MKKCISLILSLLLILANVPYASRAETALDNGDEERLRTVVTHIENVLYRGGDRFGDSPLIADGINTITGEYATWRFPDGSSAVVSNLATQSNLMRSLMALSAVTDNPKYEKRVEDIYNLYLNRYMAPNNLLLWGGHIFVDLITKEPVFSPSDTNMHELKDSLPYLDMFFNLDEMKAHSMVKSVWMGHVTDFSTVLFNRHAKTTATFDPENTWNKTDIYYPKTGLESSTMLPFRSTGDDLIYFASSLYKHTGDETALIWATRLWDRYMSARDPDTHLGGLQFTTAEGAPGVKDPMTTLEPLNAWWTADPMPSYYTHTTYGDRAKNQFEDDMLAQGIITQEQKDNGLVREANVVFDSDLMIYPVYVDLNLAKTIGINSDKGREIVAETVKSLASYAQYAYVPEENKFHPIWSDGTKITGYIRNRSGYYGKAGKVYTTFTANAKLLNSYTIAYFASKGRNDLASEREQIWNVIRGIAKGYGLGDIGTSNGHGRELNLDTTCNNPEILIGVVSLYKETKVPEFLELGRRIADNMIASYFKDGLFVKGENYKYASFNVVHPYALIALYAAAKGIEIPEYFPYDGYYQADYLHDNGSVSEKTFDDTVFWNVTVTQEDKINCPFEILDEEHFDFDDEYEGQSIDGINYFSDTTHISSVEKSPEFGDGTSFRAANKMLKIGDGKAGRVDKIFADMDGNRRSAGRSARVSTRIYTSGSSPFSILVTDTKGVQLARLDFNEDNTVTCEGQSFSISSKLNKIFEIAVEIIDNVYNVSIDGLTVLSDIAVNPQSNGVAGGLSFETNGMGSVYVDDIVFRHNKRPEDNNADFLEFSHISNEPIYRVTEDLTLPDTVTLPNGEAANIVWVSEDMNIIAENGKVTRPRLDTRVKLYAFVGSQYTKCFEVTVLGSGYVYTYDSFDDYANGSIHGQNDWSLLNVVEPPTMVSEIVTQGSNKVLKLMRLTKNTINERPYKVLKKDGVVMQLTGEIIISTRIFLEKTSTALAVSAKDKNKKPLAMAFFTANRVFKNEVSGSTITIKKDAFPTNEWFDFTMIVNTTERTYNAYINNVRVNPTPMSFYYPDSGTDNGSISIIEIDIKKEGNSECIWYIDDVTVKEVGSNQYVVSSLEFSDGTVKWLNSIETVECTIAASGAILENITIKQLSKEAGDLAMFVALYMDNRLNDLKPVVLPLDKKANTLFKEMLSIKIPEIEGETCKIKVLVWRDLISMEPVKEQRGGLQT